MINIFSPSPVFTVFSVGMAAVAGFVVGFLIKSSVVSKHKRRVLSLEDEMLSNHSRILDLEKKLAELQKEKETSAQPKKAELKVS